MGAAPAQPHAAAARLSLDDWTVERWLNVAETYSVADLRGRVVLAAAFQMLCPGCVEQTVPQLRRAAATFPREQVAVVGLHTVFEHHEAMAPTALRAFLHEYRVSVPVAVDRPASDGSPVPLTMARFAMQGTPTVMVFDRDGTLRRQTFGHVPDLQLGAEVAELAHDRFRAPPQQRPSSAPAGPARRDRCHDGVCAC